MASGRPDSPNSYWWQHDFFVHDETVDTANTTENGQWLRGPWYTAANGGFEPGRSAFSPTVGPPPASQPARVTFEPERHAACRSTVLSS